VAILLKGVCLIQDRGSYGGNDCRHRGRVFLVMMVVIFVMMMKIFVINGRVALVTRKNGRGL
jgi:hypothetical protein